MTTVEVSVTQGLNPAVKPQAAWRSGLVNSFRLGGRDSELIEMDIAIGLGPQPHAPGDRLRQRVL